MATYGFMKGLSEIMATLFVLCVIFVPLGVWKLIEILIWLCTNVDVSVTAATGGQS